MLTIITYAIDTDMIVCNVVRYIIVTQLKVNNRYIIID